MNKEFLQPIFEIVPRPLGVPDGLLELGDDAAVIFKTHWFDFSIEGTSTAGTLKAEIKKRISDQSKGFFSIDEAACIVAKATEEWPKYVRLQIWKAIDDGHLVPVNYKDFSPLPLPLTGANKHLALISVQGLTKLFEVWPVAVPPSTPAPVVAVEPAPVVITGDNERIRYEVLASRTELIDAFKFYGVEMKIFRALKDRPGLMAACRVKGQGQRGSRAEPMFCPFEVINWLVNKGIKDKPKLTAYKGWHILETKFPSVYAEKETGDPRQN